MNRIVRSHNNREWVDVTGLVSMWETTEYMKASTVGGATLVLEGYPREDLIAAWEFWHGREVDTSPKGILFESFRDTQNPRRGGMLSEMFQDVKGFAKENRNVLYIIALVVLLDHFVFEGAFRERLKNLVERALGRAEKQIEEK